MKVKELIARLLKQDQNAEVVGYSDEADCYVHVNVGVADVVSHDEGGTYKDATPMALEENPDLEKTKVVCIGLND